MVNAGAILVLSLLLNLSEVDMSLAEKFDWVMNYFKVSPPPPFFKKCKRMFPLCSFFVLYVFAVFAPYERWSRLHGMSVNGRLVPLFMASFFSLDSLESLHYTSTTNESNKGVTKPSTFLKLQYFALLIYFFCLVSACISHSVFL
jgi:hypothetical protein